MKKYIQPLFMFTVVLLVLSACHTEDPGPLQERTKDYSIIDFDRLEMGSAFNIRVEQSTTFGIEVKGDRRNIDDLEVYKSGSTLIIKFDNNANRKHDTYITISMPRLREVNFSGATVSKIVGFESDEDLSLYLSGASVSQLSAGYRKVNLVLSGASTLNLFGLGDELKADVSGASVLSAFDFPIGKADVNVSGSSNAKITVSDELKATAGGASAILYRGSPVVVHADVSGASSVQKD
ncbi:head GIN domain-containing protein [Chryseolinea lacunae]|uniref:DUF2807 domain-containing protein n=1 Tax=Chryseolinea lacunae TaxID=2801331 RepID=A0ABS1KLE5_9BACT|nr:head GIN domain-containing protein [Chryseolinea lacunae]MBL0740153.1 DUF2807 domain-containing protein [Chryseolinea lacunae]